MTEFSDYMEDAIINTMRGQATVNVAVYTALFTSVTNLEINAPDDEVSGGSYARELAGLSAPSGGASSNAGDINFTTATANWGIVSHVALVTNVDATVWGTDVHVLMWSPLDVNKQVDNGDTFKISTGDLDVAVT